MELTVQEVNDAINRAHVGAAVGIKDIECRAAINLAIAQVRLELAELVHKKCLERDARGD